MEALILGILVFGLVISVFMFGYSRGRADGIKWTRDVYNGKYDDEIFGK